MGNHTYTSDDNHCIAKNEHQKRIVAEAIWLQYLNDCLLKAELIPPHMHRQMRLKISTREQHQLQKMR